MTAESKLAGVIRQNLDWWKKHGAETVRADRMLSTAARRPDDRESVPNARELAQLRAVRQQFAHFPDHAGFVPTHTGPATGLERETGAFAGTDAAGLPVVHLRPLADQDDGAGLFEREAETVAVSDADAENIRTRESSFVWVCRNRAGEIVPEDVKAKADAAKAELEKAGMDLALALASEGVPAFMPSKAPRASIVCPDLGARIELTAFRRINFLPPVAKARRDPLVKHLEAFCEARTMKFRPVRVARPIVAQTGAFSGEPIGYQLPADGSAAWEPAGTRDRFCRMATFTAGGRIAIIGMGEDLRQRVQWFHRRLSNLNAHPLFKSHGAQMHFRASEFGSITLACPWPRVPGTEQGVPYVHLHSHVVYSFEHQLSRRRWRRFLSKVKNLWRYHWDESGKLEDVREACKYPIKPGDRSHLENAHVKAFYFATRGLHLVQPLGELREIIRERRDAALKAVRLRNAKKELELKFKNDWNARIDRLTTAQKNARAAYREQEKRRGLSVYIKAARLFGQQNALMIAAARIMRVQRPKRKGGDGKLYPVRLDKHAIASALIVQAQHCAALAQTLLRFNPRPFAEKRLAGVPKLKELARTLAGSRPMRNRIAARLAPAPYFDRITRPALLVWNFDGDYAALKSEGFVREYLDAVRPQIQRAEAALPYLRVHTSHTTAGANEAARIPLFEREEAWPVPGGPPDPILANN